VAASTRENRDVAVYNLNAAETKIYLLVPFLVPFHNMSGNGVLQEGGASVEERCAC
jgi:hypothetical protein